MPEIYCEFTQHAESALVEREAQPVVDIATAIRERISAIFKGRIDAGVARTFPAASSRAVVFVEFFFDESSIRNQLSRMIEAEAESAGVMVRVIHNTLVLQKRLAAVAFAADPRAVVAALRGYLPNVPLSFRAAGNDDDGMSRYAVIAHNVRHIENFNDLEVMDAIDGILTRRLLAPGTYRRYAES
jgi:hypothetical protein